MLAQAQEASLAQVDSLLAQGQAEAAAKMAAQLREEEPTSAVPLFQLAESRRLVLEALPLYDTLGEQEAMKALAWHLEAGSALFRQKRGWRKDRRYWEANGFQEADTAAISQKQAMRLEQAARGMAHRQALRASMEAVRLEYRTADSLALALLPSLHPLGTWCLTAGAAAQAELDLLEAAGTRVRQAVARQAEGSPDAPAHWQQSCKWLPMQPDGSDFQRILDHNFQQPIVGLHDFAAWAQALRAASAKAKALAAEAWQRYLLWEQERHLDSKAAAQARASLQEWNRQLEEYAPAMGIKRVLEASLAKAVYRSAKTALDSIEASVFVHKAAKDNLLDGLRAQLDTVRRAAAFLVDESRFYAFQQAFIDSIGPMEAYRNGMLAWADSEEQALQGRRMSRILPPSMPDSLDWQGSTFWLRPLARPLEGSPTDRPVCLARAWMSHIGGKMLVEGSCTDTLGRKSAFMAMMHGTNTLWRQEWPAEAGDGGLSAGWEMLMDTDAVLYCRKSGDSLYAEMRSLEQGELLMRQALPAWPKYRFAMQKEKSLWMAWEESLPDNWLGIHFMGLSFQGSLLGSGQLRVKGTLVAVRPQPKGLMMAGHFEQALAAEQLVESAAGREANIWAARVGIGPIDWKFYLDPMDLCLKEAHYHSDMGALRLLGRKGGCEDGEQWQEYWQP